MFVKLATVETTSAAGSQKKFAPLKRQRHSLASSKHTQSAIVPWLAKKKMKEKDKKRDRETERREREREKDAT